MRSSLDALERRWGDGSEASCQKESEGMDKSSGQNQSMAASENNWMILKEQQYQKLKIGN